MAGCTGRPFRLPTRTAMTVALAGLALPVGAAAQSPLRRSYLGHVPPAPPIVAEARTSARLALYGDPSHPAYADELPPDGIDDARGERLRAIAERFSPILRRNNFSVPRQFDALPGGRTLHIDRWINGTLAVTDSLSLDRAAVDPAEGRRLRALIDSLGPGRTVARVVQPRQRDETVLFFDFPGDDERTWTAAYQRERARAHTYAHVAVDEASAPGTGRGRFRFIVQYWFFYPFNDAANNHEGDWEHVNVHVTTAARFQRDTVARVSSPLTEEEVRRIIGDGDAMPVDSLVVARVDYYFHHSVVELDYAGAHVRPALTPHDSHSTTHIWEDAGYVNWNIRERLRAAGGRLATHPLGYIGGESRGPGELLHLRPRMRDPFNANSHGTYPFPGLWVSVGQLSATERIRGRVVPQTRAAAPGAPVTDIVTDPEFVAFGRDDITLVPDWERLVPLLARPEVAARWAWLLLPVHFGFPSTPSPGAGLIGRTNLGSVAPHGPSFHPGWNIAGPTEEHSPHVVTVLRGPAAPAGPWLALQDGWGVLNVPLAMFGMMPGFNVAVATLVPWVAGAARAVGRPTQRTVFRGALPPRVTSTGIGMYREQGRVPPAARHVLRGHRLWFDLYFGERFALENGFAWATATPRFRMGDGSTRDGTILQRRLTGGARYNVVSGGAGTRQLFVKGGYGWSRHDIAAVVQGGDTLPGTGVRRGRLPTFLPSTTWWPNTTYAGAGVELFAPKRYWVLHRAGYGVRGESPTRRRGTACARWTSPAG